MDAGILGVHAVERNHLVDLALTVGADGVAGARNREPALTVVHAGALAVLNARHHDGELHDVAAVERQLGHALVLDHAADDGVLGVESDGGGGNFHRLGHVTDFE